MLDIGFTELLLVAAIALVVLGPERLPQAIKVTAYWIGKIRRSFQTVKDELEREIGADEIKRQIHNEAVMKELSKAREQFQEDVRELDASRNQASSPVNKMTSNDPEAGENKESVAGKLHPNEMADSQQYGKDKL